MYDFSINGFLSVIVNLLSAPSVPTHTHEETLL